MDFFLFPSAAYFHSIHFISYNFEYVLKPANLVCTSWLFSSNAQRLNVPQKNVDEVRKRCFTFLVEATKQMQTRLPENVSAFQEIESISPKEALTVQDLTKLASNFPNIASDVDSLKKEIRPGYAK